MLQFFDCNAAIGRWKHPRNGGYQTATELVEILDYLQVARALVYHAQAQETHAPLGNRMLMEELCSLSGRLFASWILLPHHTGEVAEPETLVKDMLAQGVRCARILPGVKGQRFSMEAWCAGPLLSELEAHRIPVLVDFMFFRRDDPDWKLLYDISQRYPALPLVMTGWSGLASRSFFALCKACPNLYLDTSRYALYRGLEAFCEKVGPRQLIYGSGMPHVAPGVAMTTITHAEIGEAEKALIAAGNLERLLGEVIV